MFPEGSYYELRSPLLNRETKDVQSRDLYNYIELSYRTN